MIAGMLTWAPPVSFYFRVVIQGIPLIPDTDFMEVEGLKIEMETENIEEGGENNFIYQVPKRVKHGNLILKRALEPLGNALETWVKNSLDGGFLKKIKPRNLMVYLMDKDGNALRCWWCDHAYPVKWEVSGFHAQENKLAIETLELCYHLLERKR